LKRHKYALLRLAISRETYSIATARQGALALRSAPPDGSE